MAEATTLATRWQQRGPLSANVEPFCRKATHCARVTSRVTPGYIRAAKPLYSLRGSSNLPQSTMSYVVARKDGVLLLEGIDEPVAVWAWLGCELWAAPLRLCFRTASPRCDFGAVRAYALCASTSLTPAPPRPSKRAHGAALARCHGHVGARGLRSDFKRANRRRGKG